MDLDFSEADRYVGRTICARDHEAIRTFCRGFVTARAPVFRQRQGERRIRECHGDLRAEHICFAERLTMIDCIEFDAAFRNRDVAAEVAFLAMDIEFLGRPELAQKLVEGYSRLSEDDGISFLIPFYKCHLAYIRGKVESLKCLESEVASSDRDEADRAARRHFELAVRYAWSYTRIVIAVVGLSGSGKTTVAEELCRRTGFPHISSDIVRKELAGCPTDRPAAADAIDSLYSKELGDRVYDTMVERASRALKFGPAVVLDATYQRAANREQLHRYAREAGVPILFVECRCNRDEVRRRLDQRVRSGLGASDADWQVYLQQVANFEAFSSAEREETITVDSAAPLNTVIEQIEDEVRQRAEIAGS